MDKLTVKDLAAHIRKFAEVVAPQMLTVIVNDDDETSQVDEEGNLVPEYLSVNGMLAMWLQLPDSYYTPMFCGWMVAQGVSLEQYSPIDLDKAVCVALTGSEKNVVFDYIGDIDAKKKLN